MLKTAVEAATLIGVVVAVIAGLFYALGTVAWSSYLTALGFDARQFPSAGLEPSLAGFTFVLLPALCIIWAIVIAASAMKLAEPSWQKQQQNSTERSFDQVVSILVKYRDRAR